MRRLLLAASAISALFATGCPVPEPPGPSSGQRIVGADYSATAIGHWACPQTDVIVAKDRGKLLIHELTLDFISTESQTKANGHIGFVLEIGSAQFIYDVPSVATDPLTLTVKGGGRQTDTKCPPAPIPHWVK